jgi:hypothetical protein
MGKLRLIIKRNIPHELDGPGVVREADQTLEDEDDLPDTYDAAQSRNMNRVTWKQGSTQRKEGSHQRQESGMKNTGDYQDAAKRSESVLRNQMKELPLISRERNQMHKVGRS